MKWYHSIHPSVLIVEYHWETNIALSVAWIMVKDQLQVENSYARIFLHAVQDKRTISHASAVETVRRDSFNRNQSGRNFEIQRHTTNNVNCNLMLDPSENQDPLPSPLDNCKNYLLNRFLFTCSDFCRFFFGGIVSLAFLIRFGFGAPVKRIASQENASGVVVFVTKTSRSRSIKFLHPSTSLFASNNHLWANSCFYRCVAVLYLKY